MNSENEAQEIKEAKKLIGTRSTWLLGLLVVIILALASVILKGLETKSEIGSFAWVLWVTLICLGGCYFALLLIYIRPLIAVNFEELTDEAYKAKSQKEKNELNAKKLEKLVNTFNSLIFLVIFSTLASFVLAFALAYFFA